MRKLDKNDLHTIVDIEERVTGIARPNYWTKKIELSEVTQPHWASIVAEIENRVVGFLLGGSGELKFGLPGRVAWIEVIGVDPVPGSKCRSRPDRGVHGVGRLSCCQNHMDPY